MSYRPTNPNGQAPSSKSASVVIASDQIVPVSFPSYTLDAFNQVVVGQRVNDVQCVFAASGTIGSITIPVYTGSGSATWSGGQVLFSTGATNPSTVYVPTVTSVVYTPGAEIYVYFTAFFTANGPANTYQRYGLTDKVNGVFLGMEGNILNASLVTDSIITSVPQDSFNVDKLTGLSTSKFTRGGTPEALDVTKQNVYRIRMGWVGSAPIVYEVLSPDDQWVVFHINRIPNNQSVPSIQNPNLPVCAWMSSQGTTLTMGTSCWAAGTSSPYTQKGVSSGGYMPVQNAKDTSRTYMTFYVDQASTVTTEALINMSINSGGTVSAGTSYTVPVNKILRLQSISVTIKTSNTTAVNGRVRVRSAATVSAASGILMMLDMPEPGGTVTAGAGSTMTYSLPDGIEIAAGQQIGISQIASANSGQISVIVTGFLY